VDQPTGTDGDVAREQQSALGWLAIAALAAILWVASPIGVGILLGAFLAFMAQPIYDRMRRRLGPRGASLATVGTSILALVLVVGGLGWLFVARGSVLATELINSFKTGGAGERALASVARVTARVGITQPELQARAHHLASALAERATTIAEAIASTTTSALLGLFFATLAMDYILRHWSRIERRAQDVLPLRPEHTAALLDEFHDVGRATMLGAFGTGLAQGVFAAIGFWLAGAPESVLLGAATTLASFVPGIGTLLVIIPVSVVLAMTGHPVHAMIALAWGLVVVGALCDYVIRPRLTRGSAKVPSIVTFTALFGGIKVFGFKGLILGPVLVTVALAVLRLYAAEVSSRRGHAVEDEPIDSQERPA
jgi:predicted PurR-regulated permease PerM